MYAFRSRKTRGFTLIELLTVVAIIGVLAAMVVGVTVIVTKRARVTASKSAFQQWAAGLEQYKSAYGYYPYIGTKTGNDRFIDLDNKATVAEFIKCMTGKQPIFDSKRGQPLDPAEARKYNKRGEEFCSFGADSLQVNDAGAYTEKLTDRFNNSKIRIYVDANGDGVIDAPAELSPPESYDVVGGAIAAKVIVYTLKKDGPDCADVISWQ